MTADREGMEGIPTHFDNDVARALGDGWTVEAGHWKGSCYLTHEDGRRIWMATGGNWAAKGRTFLRGDYPKTERRCEHYEITVSDSKTAEQVAKDITRRLLPKYEPELAEVVAYNNRKTSDAEARKAAAQELTAMMAERLQGPASWHVDADEKNDECHLRWNGPNGGYGDIVLSGDAKQYGSINLRSLSLAQVKAVLAALRDQL